MPQQTETHLFTGSLDADSAPFAIAPGDVINAANLRWLRQDGQNIARADWMPGNVKVSVIEQILPSVAGSYLLLGKCGYEATGCLYLFLYHPANPGVILEYDTNTDTARIVFADNRVTGGLGWDATMFIDCDAVDGLLKWVDGVHDQRYVNLTTAYSASTPIPQSQLLLSEPPGVVPPVQARGSSSSATSTIQYTPLQFSYRFTDTDGITSVLAPYSTTAQPARTSEVLVSATAGNVIDITIPTAQKIPANWRRVELIARYLDTNTYFVIRRWDSTAPADVSAVNQHNANGMPLTLAGWAGATLEALDAPAAAKEFDLTPRSPQAQATTASRNILGNFYEGYDTPPAVGISTTSVNFTPTTPTSTAATVYMIVVEQKDTRWWYFAIIVRIGSRNYLLPKDCSIGRFYHDNNSLLALGGTYSTYYGEHIENGLFNVPLAISRDHLFELKEQNDPVLANTGGFNSGSTPTSAKAARFNIVVEANGLTGFVAEDQGGSANWYSLEWNKAGTGGGGIPNQILIEDAPAEFGPGGERRAFLPTVYNLGLQYADASGRRSGRVSLGAFSPAPYTVNTPQYTERLNLMLPSGPQAAIPEWAATYALTLSKAQQATRFGHFFGGIVKAAFKDGTGTVVFRDPIALLSVPAGYTIYGIAIPIPNNYKYEYGAGDQMIWSVANYSGMASVIGVYSGHVVIAFTNDGIMHTLCDGWSKDISWYITAVGLPPMQSGEVFNAYLSGSTVAQKKTSFFLLSGIQSDNNQYEVGTAFGPILGPTGARYFGPLYTTNSLSAVIYGDANTQIRTSDAGGGTGLAMSTRDDSQSVVWVNDLGRIAPTDSVGEKRLVNSVRWSNARIPGASINGFGSFDVADIKTTDIIAGGITGLIPTTRGEQDGGQMVVLCEHGSFTALVGQQTLSGADGQQVVAIAGGVFGDFNPIRGGYGCTARRSITRHQQRVWFCDTNSQEPIEFNESGAGPINFKTSRLFRQLLARVRATHSESRITFGVNPSKRELLVSIPAPTGGDADPLSTTSLPYPFDAYINQPVTLVYNWETNGWQPRYDSGAEFLHVGNLVFGWQDGKLWREFSGAAGSYYGGESPAMVAAAFNVAKTTIITPESLRLLADRAPDTAWVMVMDGPAQRVAGVSAWSQREGAWVTSIRRDRTSNGATDEAQWKAAGINGRRLKGNVVFVVLVWNGSASINATSLSLDWQPSSGMPKG